jgi:hypothetical protein
MNSPNSYIQSIDSALESGLNNLSREELLSRLRILFLNKPEIVVSLNEIAKKLHYVPNLVELAVIRHLKDLFITYGLVINTATSLSIMQLLSNRSIGAANNSQWESSFPNSIPAANDDQWKKSA